MRNPTSYRRGGWKSIGSPSARSSPSARVQPPANWQTATGRSVPRTFSIVPISSSVDAGREVGKDEGAVGAGASSPAAAEEGGGRGGYGGSRQDSALGVLDGSDQLAARRREDRTGEPGEQGERQDKVQPPIATSLRGIAHVNLLLGYRSAPKASLSLEPASGGNPVAWMVPD
jgi:hypothetical protein